MTNKEVIDWLEFLSLDAKAKADSIIPTDIEIACEIAINALNMQEPRALTLDDLDAIYHKHKTHFWPYNTPPYMWMEVNPEVRPTNGFWISWGNIRYSLENDNPFYVRENYGKAWVIFTKEPKDDQREAIPWEK